MQLLNGFYYLSFAAARQMQMHILCIKIYRMTEGLGVEYLRLTPKTR